MSINKPCLLFVFVLIISVTLNVIKCENSDDDHQNKNVEDFLKSGLHLEHEIVEEQADQPKTNSEEKIVAIHIDAVGSKENLRPTLKGLSQMATEFLPSGYKFLEILSATREVVAGVKYELLVNSEDDNGTEVVCHLEILERPWVANSKYRNLQYSNCSSAEDLATSVTEEPINLNPLFDPEKRDKEFTEEGEKDVERQIIQSTTTMNALDEIFGSDRLQKNKPVTEGPLDTSTLSNNALDSLDKIFNPEIQSASMNNLQQNNLKEVQEDVIVPKKVEVTYESQTESSPATPHSWWRPPTPFEQQVQQSFNEVFKTHREIQRVLDEIVKNGGGPSVQKQYENVFNDLLNQIRSQINNIHNTHSRSFYLPSPPSAPSVPKIDAIVVEFDGNEAQPKTVIQAEYRAKRSLEGGMEFYEKIAKESAEQLDYIDADDFKRIILKVLDAKTIDGNEDKGIFLVRVQMANSHCIEGSEDDNCRNSLIRKSNKRCTFEIRVKRDDVKLVKSECNPPDYDEPVLDREKRALGGGVGGDPRLVGAPEPFTEEELKDPKHMERIVNGMAAYGKCGCKGIVILNGTKQVVSGIKYSYNILSDDPKLRCTVTLWQRAWLDGDAQNQYTANCDTPDEGSRRKRSARPRGAPRELTEEELKDQSHIDRITEGLKSYGSGSVGKLAITRGSVQVVAGNLFKYEVVSKSPKMSCQVEVWERLWLDDGERRKYTINCDKPDELTKKKHKRSANLSRNRRQTLIGGPRKLSASELQDRSHIDRISYGLKSYGSGNAGAFDILEGTTKVVSGVLYSYKIAVKNPKMKCDVDVWERPWMKGNEGKKYTFNCDRPDEVSKARSRRSVEDRIEPVMLGAPWSLSASELQDSAHIERITMGLKTYGSGDTGDFDILEGNAQVVQGLIYKYKILVKDTKMACNVKVWERLWLKDDEKRIFTVDCDKPDEVSRSKRQTVDIQPPIPGAPSSLSASELQDDSHIERITMGLKTYGSGNTGAFDILEGNAQVVQGIIYKYKILVKDTKMACNVKVWERLWLNDDEKRIFTVDCDKPDEVNRSKRQIVGGSRPLTEEELKDSSHLERITIGLKSYTNSLNTENFNIRDGSIQVVAGHLYKYNVDVKDPQLSCKVEVWERSWLAEPENQKFTIDCGQDEVKGQRKRRSTHGGFRELTNEELKDKSHIERITFGLQTYGAEKTDNVHIITGTVQAVAGQLFRYKVAVDEPKTMCNVEIWERLWLEGADKRKYTIDCNEKFATKHTEYSTKGEEYQRHMFEKFKLKHKRKYKSSMEHEMRFTVFKNNLFIIDQLNKHEQGTAKYGITHFADMTESEYKMRTGLVRNSEEQNEVKNPKAQIPDIELPEEFDWRDKGAVTQVKNQGSCGSCWAFSVVGNIESLHAIKYGTLEEYSEQELLDCDTLDGACNGGEMDNAYKAIEKIGGLEYESEYPYEAKKHKTCNFNASMSHVQVAGAVDLPKDEVAMAKYLVENGPISIGLNANAMQFYRGGISHPWRPLCMHSGLDHGVLIVGYGTKSYPMFNKTLPYWIIKNSWGPKWGEQGYYRIYRGDNSCGVAEMATTAVLA